MPDFPYATYKSTRAPLPLDVYERTGAILQDKYYKNRDRADQVYSMLSNLKVDPTDQTLINQTIVDVDSELAQLEGKWHYADNVIRNVVKKIDGNKALRTAVEDEAIFQSQLSELQKKALDKNSGVTNELVDAFVKRKRLAKQPIYQDQQTGVVMNRYIPDQPPIKPDVDKMAMQLVEAMTKNPKEKAILLQKYNNNSAITNMLVHGTSTYRTEDEIYNAVKNALLNDDSVKNYYDYINSTNLAYELQDKSIVPNIVSLLRGSGFDINDDLTMRSDNYVTYDAEGIVKPLLNDKGKTVKNPNYISDIKNDPIIARDIKLAKDQGLNDNQAFENALRNYYLRSVYDKQMSDISSTYKPLAFDRTHYSYINDQNALDNQKFKREHNIYNVYTNPNASIPKNQVNIKEGIDLYIKYRNEYNAMNSDEKSGANGQDILNKMRTLEYENKSYINQFSKSKEGSAVLSKLKQELLNKIETNDYFGKDRIKKSFDKYILGETDGEDLINVYAETLIKQRLDYNKKHIINEEVPTKEDARKYAKRQITNLKETYLENLQDAIDEKKVTIQNNALTFTDAENAEHPLHKNLGEYIRTSGDSWEIVAYNNENKLPATLGDMFSGSDPEINSNLYDMQAYPINTSATSDGSFKLVLTPKENIPYEEKKKLSQETIVVRPNSSSKTNHLMNVAKMIDDLGTENPQVKEYSERFKDMALNGDVFAPILLDISMGLYDGERRNVDKVAMNTPNGIITFDGYIQKEGDNIALYDNKTNKLITTATNIPELMNILQTYRTAPKK